MNEQVTTSHPLDASDPGECYKVMMSERTELVKARREAEDGAIRTKTQISSAVLSVLAAFSFQKVQDIDIHQIILVIACAVFLVFTIVFGVVEQRWASKAYLQQQEILEKYYTKQSNTFIEPPANIFVRRFQKFCMVSFVLSMICIAALVMLNLGMKYGRYA